MGFTIKLALAYAVLFVIDIAALLYGLEKNSWIFFFSITAVMVLGIAVLGYMWITSPM